jgi:hypothetical protein
MKIRLTNQLTTLAMAAFLPIAGWVVLAQKTETAPKKKLAISIKPRDVADNLHAALASDREVYTKATASHVGEKNFMSPCELLRLSTEATASKGVEFSYVLRALRPVKQRNAPETDAEKKGLEFVATRPGEAYYEEELLGGRWYFTAVYPDVAVNSSCVSCHNQNPDSPKKDFKTGDVMGGLIVRVALEL